MSNVIDATGRFEEATAKARAYRREKIKESIYDLRRSSERFKKVVEEYKRKRETYLDE